MPTLEVKTVEAKQVWASPDGQRKIFDLQLEWEGKPVKASTYSDAIASPGWSGTVETYEKEGKFGPQTFVKRPQKAGGGYSGGHSGGGYRGAGGGAKADPFTMYLSYAKDLAVAAVHEGKFDDKLYTNLLGAVEAGGAQLYAGRPEAQDKLVEAPANKEEVTVEDLNLALGGTEIDAGETPWPPKS